MGDSLSPLVPDSLAVLCCREPRLLHLENLRAEDDPGPHPGLPQPQAQEVCHGNSPPAQDRDPSLAGREAVGVSSWLGSDPGDLGHGRHSGLWGSTPRARPAIPVSPDLGPGHSRGGSPGTGQAAQKTLGGPWRRAFRVGPASWLGDQGLEGCSFGRESRGSAAMANGEWGGPWSAPSRRDPPLSSQLHWDPLPPLFPQPEPSPRFACGLFPSLLRVTSSERSLVAPCRSPSCAPTSGATALSPLPWCALVALPACRLPAHLPTVSLPWGPTVPQPALWVGGTRAGGQVRDAHHPPTDCQLFL